MNQQDYLYRGFKHYRIQTEDELTVEDMQRIYSKLSPYVANEEQLKEHKENVHKRYLN